MVDKKNVQKSQLLETRKRIKSKKPEFLQQDYHKKRRLSAKWKRPTGLQSKMRHQFKGYARRVKQGWRSPAEIRGYHLLGYEPVLVFKVEDLATIQKHQGAIIASNVGVRKKILIIDKAVQLQIPILNIKTEQFKAKVAQKQTKAQEEKKQKEEHKKKSLEDALKKSEKAKKDKEKAAAESNAAVGQEKDTTHVEKNTEKEKREEEQKEKKKKEKDDILIHKQ